MKPLLRILVVLVIAGFYLGAAATTQPRLGDQVVKYCRERKGQKVGDGQCAALPYWALKEAGAARRGPDSPNDGDYVWGELVVLIEGDPKMAKFAQGKSADLRPGDILQFRNTRFSTQAGKKTRTARFGHHSAVLGSSQGANVQIWHQNFSGEQTVTPYQLRLTDLKEGWIRIYRPLAHPTDAPADETPTKAPN